jgi:hypothetical protein
VNIALKTITFNHDTASASTSAMNIRRNKDFEVSIPEYDAAIPRTPAESCAAYAKLETTAQNVFVRTVFTGSGGGNPHFEVQALGGGVLGALDPQSIDFTGGATTKTVDFPLTHRNFAAIARQDVTWQWQFRDQGNPNWQSLVSTSHRIYVVLKVPPAPWTQTPADKRNPWTDLLDFSCVIATEAQSAGDAAELITKKVHTGYSLRYDIQSGAPRYGFVLTGSSLQLTNWINYVLKGNAPATPIFCNATAEQYKDFWIVNCYDCAASAALMAKLVGADSDYYFHSPFGYLNYVEPIGRGKCNNPFYQCQGGATAAVGPDDARTSFGNHAYQKLGGTKNYDACMREWLSPLAKFLLILVWFILLIISFGTINAKNLLLRAGGWLIDLTQADYNTRTIDTDQPFEAAAASGGTQALQTLNFSVT